MKRKIVYVLLVALFLCGCEKNKTEENLVEETQREESVTEDIDIEKNVSKEYESNKDIVNTEIIETEEAEEQNTDIGNTIIVKEDKAIISRDKWIEKALQEEEARRVMPELQGAKDIIAYIAKTGGKAYKGTYEGDTYYLYLTAECNYYGKFTPYVTVVKEKDTNRNPKEFGGRENFYGIIRDETELFLDVHSDYKCNYTGPSYDIVIGDDIESNGDGEGLSIHFNSGTDIIYTFKEQNIEPDINGSRKKEIQFFFLEPDEAKYWYSQNAMSGQWNDFMYYDGYYGDYYVRVEFTDGQNMTDASNHYYMTVLSSVEDLDTFDEKKFQIMTKHYSYSEFSKLEDDEFMLEFISERQAVLTNKQTGTSALVKYNKGYLTEREGMNDSEYYFYDKRIVDRHDYRFEEKDYTASDGTIISFSAGSSRVDYKDVTDVGERIVDIFYQGGRSALTAPVQIVDGKTLRIIEMSSNTDLLFVWSDDNHFEVKGTGDYVPNINGMSFSYEENKLYGY